MLETDAPSLFFDPWKPDSSNDDKGLPTTPQSTYEAACWLARLRDQPVSEVLEAAANNFEEFYGRFWRTSLLLSMLYNISICVQMPRIYCILSLCSFYVLRYVHTVSVRFGISIRFSIRVSFRVRRSVHTHQFYSDEPSVFLSVYFILGAKILAFSCSGAHGK